jgi:hypothetical protein
MFGLLSLPYEVLSNIVANINFDDVFNLGRTCKELQFLLTEESICKSIVQVSDFRLVATLQSGFRLLTERRDQNPVFQ